MKTYIEVHGRKFLKELYDGVPYDSTMYGQRQRGGDGTDLECIILTRDFSASSDKARWNYWVRKEPQEANKHVAKCQRSRRLLL